MHNASILRVALRHLEAETSVLNGVPRRKAITLVNAVLQRAPTGGFFKDDYWKGIKAIWEALEKADIQFSISKSDYEYDQGFKMPIRKVWVFEIPFVNDKGKQDIIWGRAVAGGAGPVNDPLARYDVVTYAS